MKITAIKAQIKRTGRVSVYIDGAYVFSLSHAQLLGEGLHAGQEVNEERVHALARASDFGKAYERALMYVMLRPRSVRETEQYCARKKWAEDDCRAIVGKLVARGYVDDATFARSWIDNRMRYKHIALRTLRAELRQKGVPDDIVHNALEESAYSEADALRALIEKKRKLARFAHDNQKLTVYLGRQGFSFDAIHQALR